MGKKILLADDSITIQKVIELTFSDEDFDVVTVGNGRLAIERVAELAPDVVLCDIIMPEKDGYEVCEHIKKTAGLSHIPVLLLTGAFEPFDQERATRVGADGFLAKPFEPQTLIAKVKDLLERGQAARASAARPAEPPRSATVPMPIVGAPPAAPVAAFEPMYVVEESESAEFQPLETAGGFEALEAAPYEPLEPASEASPLDAFVSEPRATSSTVAFIPQEPLHAPAARTLRAEPVREPELVAEPELLVEMEPAPAAARVAAAEITVEPEFVAEPIPAELEVDEGEPLLVAEAEVAPPAVGFEAIPAVPEAPAPATTAEVPLEERARAAVEAAYGAVFAPADEVTFGEAAVSGPAAAGGEAVFEFESGPGESVPAGRSVEEPETSATAELTPDEMEVTGEPATVIETAPSAAAEATFEEASFEEAFDAVPAPPVAREAGVASPRGADWFVPSAPPSPAAMPQPMPASRSAEHAAPRVVEAEETSFEDVAPPPAPEPRGASVAAELGVPVDMVAAIAQRVVGQLSEKVIREIAWEVVPELAEALIKKEIERLRAELDRLPK